MTDPVGQDAHEVTPRVAIVIVNHNTRDDVVQCLASLPDAGADEIVVVDCGSSDGSAEAVRERHPDVTVLELANIGYGQGANAGMQATSAPLVAVANADTRFDRDALTILAEALEQSPDVAAAGPQVRYPDGRRQASARTFPTLGQAAGHALFGLWWPDNPWTRAYRQSDLDPDRPRDVDWLSGCALLLRRAAFDQIGGFDPGYWMYVEDVDLGYRLRQAGWRIRFEPAAGVEHEVGASAGQKRSQMVIAHARSLDRFYGRAYASGPGRLLQPFVRLGLVLWVGLVLAWTRIVGRRTSRSSTGE